VKYVRKADGRFDGSLPTKTDVVPSPEFALPCSIDLDEPGTLGEVADLDALYSGWLARQSASREPVGLSSEADAEELLGLQAAAADPRIDSIYAGTNPLLEDSDSNAVPAAHEALAAWERLQAPLQNSTDALDALEYRIAKSLDATSATSLSSGSAGISAFPTGGIRYSAWRHEDLQSALAPALAEHGDTDTPRQSIAAVMGEYFSYATPSYYRIGALQRLGIAPENFATPGQDDRRLVIRGLSREATNVNPVVLSGRLAAHAEECQVALEEIPVVCEYISTADLSRALTQYAALRNRQATIREAVSSLREVARRQVEMQGKDGVDSASGTSYRIVPGRKTSRVDNEATRPYVIAAISRDIGVRPETVEKIVSALDEVAQFGPYRLRAIEAKTDAPLELCVRQQQTPSRLIRVEQRQEEAGHDG
jgi:hypothetical protein